LTLIDCETSRQKRGTPWASPQIVSPGGLVVCARRSCCELASQRFAINSLNMESNRSTRSSYTVATIMNSIARLPFFRDVSQEQLSRALELAPTLYERFLAGRDRQFAAEMTPLLDQTFGFRSN
jgi:hypothetical protein